MVSDTGDITMNAVFRVSEVVSILAAMSEQQVVYHNVTDECAIPPITVKNTTPFVINMATYAAEQLLCNLCDPPVTIGKSDYDTIKMQRAVRNHMAAHQLINNGDITEEQCAFCTRPSCKLQVTGVTPNTLSSIITDCKPIPPGAKVHTNCTTYSIN